LSVTCDASKPLRSFAPAFTGDDTDPGISRARQKGHSGPLGWKLLGPIRFVDSRNHPSVQLADIVAGTIVAVSASGLPEDGDAIGDSLQRHVLDDSILPDIDVIDLKNRSAAVNALILYDLAKRAERHADPYVNLAAMYRLGEVSWASGQYDLLKAGTRPRIACNPRPLKL
jgi:hypothetical protein